MSIKSLQGLNSALVSWSVLQCSLTQPIAVAHGNIEYIERFAYLGSVISRDGDVEANINTRLAKAAAIFQSAVLCLGQFCSVH